MPYEFEDLSKELSKGSVEVEKNLEKIAKAADKADKAYLKMTKTQKASLEISKKFDKALQKNTKNLFMVGKFAGVAAKDFRSMALASVKVIGSIADLSAESGSAAAGFRNMADSSGTLVSQLSDTDKAVLGLAKDVEKLGDGLSEIGSKKVSVEVEAKGKENVASLNDGIKELDDSVGSLRKQIDKTENTVFGQIKKTFLEGKRDALEFSGGIGETAKGMTAAGVAAYFMFQKVGAAVTQFRSGAKELARYKVETAALGKTIMGATGPSIDSMRKQLSLTREQSVEFFDVLKDGSNSLGLTKDRLMEVAKSLQETFGGDPTARLKEYVGLLKEIPTLDKDLKIGASLDDQAAAIFALAEKGKMDVVVDLQSAGLLGGEKEQIPGAELLKTNQKTEFTMEAMGDFLTGKMYPTWGPYLAGTVEGVSKLVEWSGAIIATVGGMSTLLAAIGKEQVIATYAAAAEVSAAIKEEALVRATGARVPGGAGGSAGRFGTGQGMKSLWTSLVGSVKTASTKVWSFAKSVPGAVKGLSSLAKGLSIGAAATAAISFGLGKWSDSLEKSGDVVGAAGAGLASGLSDVAGWALAGAALGSVFPVVGTALGALAGAAVGLVANFKDIAKQTKILYNAWKIDKKLGEEGKKLYIAFKRLREVEMKYLPIWKKRQEELAKSGQLLQQAMEKNERAFNNLKFRLYDFERDLAKADIGALSDVGGSSEAFAYAVKDMTEAVSSKFKGLTDSLENRRKEIMKTEGMLPEQRKQALEQLHKMELDATREFVEGMREVSEALFKTPELMVSGIKAKTATMTLEDMIQKGVGGVGVGESMMDELGKEIERMTEGTNMAVRKSADRQVEIQKELDKKKEDAEKGFLTEYGKYGEDRKKIDADIQEKGKKAAENLQKANQNMWAEEKRLQDEQAAAAAMGEAGPAAAAMIDTKAYDEAREAAAKAERQFKAMKREMAREDAFRPISDALKKAVVAIKEAKTPEDKKKAEEELNNVYESSSKIVEDLTKRSEELNKKLPKFLTGTADQLGKARDAEKKLQEEMNKAAEEVGAATGDKRVKAIENQKAVEKQLEEKQKEISGIEDELKGVLQERLKGTVYESNVQDVMEGLVVSTNKSAGRAVDNLEGMKDKMAYAKDAIDDTAKTADKEASSASEELSSIKERLAVAEEVKEGSGKVVKAIRGSVAVAEMIAMSEDKLLELEGKESALGRIRLGFWKVITAKMEDELAEAEVGAEVAKKSGNAVKEMGNLLTKQNEISVNKLKYLTNKAIPELRKTAQGYRKNFDKLEDEYNKAVEGAKERGVEKPEEDPRVKAAAMARDAAKRISDEADRNVRVANQEISSTLSQLKSYMDVVDDMFSNLGNTLEGKVIKAQKDLGDALTDSAIYSNDLGKAANEGFEVSKAAAQKELELRRKTLAESISKMREQAEIEAESAMTAGRPQDAARIRAEAEVNIKAKERLENAKMETDLKKQVVDAAKKSAQLKSDELDVTKDNLQAQIDIAEAFDKSAAVMGPLLNRQLAVEKERLKEMKKLAAESRKMTGNSLETRRLESDIVKKEAEIRKTEYDNAKKVIELRRTEVNLVQGLLEDEKSYLEEIGGSFGQLVDVQGQIIGLEREKLAMAKEELDVAVKQGATGAELLEKQVAVRQAELGLARKQMGLQKNIMEKMLGAAFGAISDVGGRKQMGTDQALLGVAGTRVKTPAGMYTGGPAGTPEENMLKAQMASMGVRGMGMMGVGGMKKVKTEADMAKVRDNTGDIKTNTEGLAKKGSAYVSDETTQGLLKSILSVLTNVGKTMVGVGQAGAGGDVGAKGEAGVAGDVTQKIADNTEDQLKATKKELRTQIQQYNLAKKENKSTKKMEQEIFQTAEKLKSLEANVRGAEMGNPLAGAAAGIEDYDRVMSGRTLPEMEKFSKELSGATKQTKATLKGGTLAGTKFGMHEMGGTKFGMHEMGGTKFGMDTLGGGGKAKSMGDVKRTAKAQAKEIGTAVKGSAEKMGSKVGSEMGASMSESQSESVAAMQRAGTGGGIPNAAAGAMTPMGGAGAAGAQGAGTESIKVVGEINVHFDSKMFKTELKTLVAELIRTPEITQALDKRYLTQYR